VALAFSGCCRRKELPPGPAVDAIDNGLLGEGHERPGQHTDDVPAIEEANRISFELYPIIPYIVPRVTVFSRRNSEYVAMHSDFREAEWTARKISPNMEWHQLNDIKRKYRLINLRPDIFKKFWYEFTPVLPDLALSASPDVNDLTLVADFSRMLRPEINVEIMDSNDWVNEIKIADIVRHHAAMRPRSGTFVVCRQEIPVAAQAELEAAMSAEPDFEQLSAIRLIHAGYEVPALEAIVSAIPVKHKAAA
jgi:hypothetical protein